MTDLVLRTDSATAEAVCAHLERCNASFIPPLSTRVNLADYAARLCSTAGRFEAWDGPCLIALAAVYCNAPDLTIAFVSNVSVETFYQHRGLARSLLEAAICHVRTLGFARMTLEVDAKAAPALALYRALGFRIGAENGTTLTMHLDLRKGAA